MTPLDSTQIQTFHSDGYLIFERFFDVTECADLKADIDEKMREGGTGRLICEYPHLGPLISHPRVMDVMAAVLGPGFAFHHLHAVRQDEGARGVHWHQDYEQYPQTNRTHTMVHFFYYFNGLNGQIGDLLFVPRSQQAIVGNDALRIFGTETLPGTVVVDDLPPGSAVLVHSALWHARRAKPGGAGSPRYFADASYCQAGVRWPSYGTPQWRAILARALELGLDRDGAYAHLFDTSHFFDELTARAFLRPKHGSLVLEMRDWQE
jgi:hypothetical protein